MFSIITRLLLLITLSGCYTTLDKTTSGTPQLAFEEFFNQSLCAWGLVRNRSGGVIRKFSASIEAVSQGDQVTLDEIFLFDDGEYQSRFWKFNKQGEQWQGSASDVVGVATGVINRDSFYLNYSLSLFIDGRRLLVDMDDWLYLVDSNTLMGSTEMSKWGFKVGQIDIVIQKHRGNVNQCIEQLNKVNEKTSNEI